MSKEDLKMRLKAYRKKLDTSKRRFTRIGKYAKVKNKEKNKEIS